MQRILHAFDREEKGLPPRLTTRDESANASNDSHKQGDTAPSHPPHFRQVSELLVSGDVENTLIPSNNKLLVFRSLTGIDDIPVLKYHGFFSDRSASNRGIYTRVVDAETFSAKKYLILSLLINTCLAIQIIVAAALTALGAANGPNGAVTAFGAINTIMAGILTYLKASGLPNREKNTQQRWAQVREHIEQREREFCLHDCQLDVEEEVQMIENMYLEVRQSLESEASDKSGSKRADTSRPSARGARMLLPKVFGMVNERLEGQEESATRHQPPPATIMTSLGRNEPSSQTDPVLPREDAAVRPLSTMSGKTFG